jgi:glycerophosphoryl diester phosphodiesterase
MDGSPAVLAGPVPFVMAHRGFDLDGLENSMRAFEAAVRMGVTFLETDVQATSDGVLVAFHDTRLDRVTDRCGEISKLTWQQVRQARIGGVEPVPRLEEVLSAWPDVRVNIDLKTSATVGPFVSAVRGTGARDRIVVASFSDRRRSAAVRELSEDGPVAWSPGTWTIGRVVMALGLGACAGRRSRDGESVGTSAGRFGRRVARVSAALRGAPCLQVPPRVGAVTIVTREMVDVMHAAGAQVHVWTIDDPLVMERLLRLGVDALVTNRSDLAVEVLARGSGAF